MDNDCNVLVIEDDDGAREALSEYLAAAGYRVIELDHTAPVPVVGTPSVERGAHAIASLRPSLLAYQFLLAATPR